MSWASDVAANHGVIEPPSTGDVTAVELPVTSSFGYPLPAAWMRFQASRYAPATFGSSMIRPLLACVHRPLVVQFVLPVRTRTGLPAESQKTTNLLWAKCPSETMRSKTLIFVLFRNCARTSAFSSGFARLNAPLPRTRLQSGPNAARAGINSGSLSSYRAAKILPFCAFASASSERIWGATAR